MGKLICHVILKRHCSKANKISGVMQRKNLKNSVMCQDWYMTTKNIQEQGDSFRLYTEFITLFPGDGFIAGFLCLKDSGH